jgi:biotin carboxyl carrier protein
MEMEFNIDEKIYQLNLEFKDGQYRINLADREYVVDSSLTSDNCLSLLVNGKAFTVYFAEADGKSYFSIGGEQFCIQEAKSESVRASEADSSAVGEAPVAASPMPGKVVKILVKEGNQVEKGQGLVIVEAMKMENEIKSPVKGTVEKINFKPGDLVDAAQPILEIRPEEKK